MESYELSPIAGAMHRRLRLAGMLIVLALLVEVISLFWTSPIAFLVFMFVDGLLLTIGVVVYLYSLVSVTRLPVQK